MYPLIGKHFYILFMNLQYPMYLSSDSSSILVLCHRSPLSIIHYCNTGRLNHHHQIQRFSDPILFECFFFSMCLNLGIHLPQKTSVFVFIHILAFLMVNQCLVGVWIYQLISWTFWVVNLFVFHHWIILFSPTITNIYTFPSKQKQTLRNYSIGWISNLATSSVLSE